jgi:polyhydroxyalkanoate synthesis regulator phasin
MLAMTKRRKLTLVAGTGGAVLLIAGLGAAGAIGASYVLSPSDESKAIIEDAATQLGVEPSELSGALKEALKNRIDEAVDEGRLTEEQADALKDRIDENEYPLLGGPWKFGLGLHGPPGLDGFKPFGFFGHFELLSIAASYLGMTEAELRDALEDKTLAEIAREQGKTAAGLVQQLVATQTKRIDEAVEAGKLSDEQADALKENLQERMQELVNAELRWRSDGDRHRFWPGSGSPRAPPPWPFGGPSA